MLQKVENFCNAVARLQEAVDALDQHPSDTVVRDGVIQRFSSPSSWPGSPFGNTWRTRGPT